MPVARRPKPPTDTAGIPDKPFFKIGEAARLVGVKPYVLRYWQSEFRSLRPQKTRSQQRLYRRQEIELLLKIRHLLYDARNRPRGVTKTQARARRSDTNRRRLSFRNEVHRGVAQPG
jgi:hypothetical protein